MTREDRLNELRELFFSSDLAVDVTRALAIIISLSLVVVVLWLVRARKLRAEYTPIWMIAAFALALLSLRFDILYGITRAIGAWTASSTLFFLGQVFLTVVCLNYAIRLSQTNVQIKNLAQEIALLKAELEEGAECGPQRYTGSRVQG